VPAKPKVAARTAKKPAPKRLGEELAPLRRGEDLNLIVARTKVVAGKIQFTVDAPQSIRGLPGGKVLVKHVYRLQEHSPEREEYRVLLRSSLNGKEHAPSLARFGDNYAMPDDYSGFLLHEYRLPATGKAVLEFDVGAEYTVGSWKTTEVDSHEMKTGKGSVTIHIG
jgi:hypothetical protein